MNNEYIPVNQEIPPLGTEYQLTNADTITPILPKSQGAINYQSEVIPSPIEYSLQENQQFTLDSIKTLTGEILRKFANDDDLFVQVLRDKANTPEIQLVRSQWLVGDFSQLPFVQVLSAADMNGAVGAYDSANNNIYLSDTLFGLSAAPLNSVNGGVGVLVEETFHWLDNRVGTDTPGDEGELARNSVFGVHLSNAELNRINQEDDRGYITVYGQIVPVEMAVVSNTANTLQTAQNIGVLGSTTQVFTGFVGDNIVHNYLKFQVTTPSVFSVELSGLTKDANVRLLNAQGNFIQASYNKGTATDSFTYQLGAGNFFVHVYREAPGDNTNYTLKLSAPPVINPSDSAGNTLITARKLGVLNGSQSLNEFVSPTNDSLDIFEFNLPEYSNFNVALSGMTAPISMKLLDYNQNIIKNYDPSTPGSFEILQNLPAGNYYIAIGSKWADTAYTLTTRAYSDVEKYIDFSQSISTNEVHTRTGWVGDIDVHDFIPFKISSGGNIKLDLTGLTANANLRLLYYPEGTYESVPLYGNSIDPAFVSKLSVVQASYNLGSNPESISHYLDKPGKYFIHIYSETPQDKTFYNLAASFIPDYAGNTPEQARFLEIPYNSSMGVSDRVHDGDRQDYYQIGVGVTSDVRIALQSKSADVNLKVFDKNFNFVQASYNPGTIEDVITLKNLAAGAYYILAYQEKSGTDSEYTLQTSITGQYQPSTSGGTTISLPSNTSSPQWQVQYFNNSSLNGTPVYSEAMGNPSNGNNRLNFAYYWGENAPNSTLSKDNFSARVKGSSYLDSGEYRITVNADDGIRIRVNGQTIIDKWVDQEMKFVHTGTFSTTGGNVPIEVDYYENTGYAGLNFLLERIGDVRTNPSPNPSPTSTSSNNNLQGQVLGVREQRESETFILGAADRISVLGTKISIQVEDPVLKSRNQQLQIVNKQLQQAWLPQQKLELSWLRDDIQKARNEVANQLGGDGKFEVTLSQFGTQAKPVEAVDDTWIVIHGWNNSPETWSIKNLAQAVQNYSIAKPQQVLMVDWSEAAKTGDNLGPRGVINLAHAAGRIEFVADAVVKLIKEAKLVGKRINFIGHSLGAYVGAEISERLTNLGAKPEQLILLDPANNFTLNTLGNSYNPNVDYKNVANFSRAFYGSAAGDTASKAHESFKIEYNGQFSNPGARHGDVVTLYANFLQRPQGGVSRYFGLEDNKPLDFVKHDPNWDWSGQWRGLDGTIKADWTSDGWIYPQEFYFKSSKTNKDETYKEYSQPTDGIPSIIWV
ncbi:pre-peptidase C-terminal domain-containing protein [Anabaena azotica]|uniref:pre-peptidase C-terminal domain-containing protein n=1 Tax=Anabaena azotica TaxID=197653 RepID=UPI0039A61EB6